MYNCFATTSAGMEQILANELNKFGANVIHIGNSGVSFKADANLIMYINIHSRLASRILLELASSKYTHESDVYQLALDIKWYELFNCSKTIKVITKAIHCPLTSLNFVTLKVKDAICDSFMLYEQIRPDVNKINPDIRIYNFLQEDNITIYIDTSGESLFKRGYRLDKLDAPLKENLAAGLIKLSNWQYDETLYDPMCGSGTIVIEALCMALNIAPGLSREFAFLNINNLFDLTKYSELLQQAKSNIRLDNKVKIYASDSDNAAIKATRINLQQLNLLDKVKLSQGDFLDKLAPELSGILITNPPYGVRLEELEDLAKFYPKLASHLKNNYANWTCYFFTSDLRMPKLMRLKPTAKTVLYNGGIECRLFKIPMVQGSNKVIRTAGGNQA